jgi:hypothetical protein
MTSFAEFLRGKLADAPAPRTARTRQRDKIAALAPMILAHCVRGQDVPLRTLAEVAGERRTNAIATALGAGVAGSGGAKLWKRDGVVLACQENASLIAEFLSDEAEAALLTDLGMDRTQFLEALAALPAASLQ